MLFSERYGYTKPREALQIESIDEPLKNGLWNILKLDVIGSARKELNHFNLFRFIWFNYFKVADENVPILYETAINGLKNWYIYEARWYDIYNFIEFVFDSPYSYCFLNSSSKFNEILEREKSGYRLINGLITPITNESEIQGIEDAINSTENNILKSVNTHLKAALTKLSNRQNPDYRNSIKESISAVEALVNIINGDTKGTLGTSIKKLKTKITIHSALESGFNSIYGYTSDAGGIRHAMMDDTNCDFDDAKYMLVSCSAFVNYLIGKASKAGLLSV